MEEQQHSPGPVRKGRTRTGCLTCRSRRVKCDEDRPICFNCTRLNRVCFYEPEPMYPNRTIYGHMTKSRTGFGKDKAGFEQAPMSTSLTINSVSDLDTFPGDDLADFNAIFGEWGDIMPTTADPTVGLWTTPENSAGHAIDLDLETTAVLKPEFSYFLSHVQPPFIVPWDLANWTYAKADIAEMASQDQTIRAAVLAMEELYETLEQGGEIAATLPSYFAAKSTYTLAIKDGQLGIDLLLVATFLLCCFEVIAQQETVSSTLKQKDLLVTTIEGHLNQKPWSLLAQRTMIWLYLFHAKAMHLGGRGMLSPKLLSLVEDQLNPLLCMPVRPGALASNAANVVTHSLQQALFQFYFQLQQISVIASSINRHHRPRGAPADEALVDGVSQKIERHLLNLWHGRPAILNCTKEAELAKMLHGITPRDLSLITLLSRLCKLCYHAEIIYYSRSQGRADSSSRRIQPAREAIRKLIVESTGSTDDDMCLLRQPALAWPLFLYSVESKSQDEIDWALGYFGLLRNNPLWHIDYVQTLVRELTQEQLHKGDRVDSRFFCVENYGVAPPFL